MPQSASIRVLYLISSLEPGGAEYYLLEILRRLDRTRYTPMVCTLISGGALKAKYEALGIEVVGLGSMGPHLLHGAFLPAVLLRFRPQVIHSRLVASNIWARVFGHLFGARVMCEELGIEADRQRRMSVLNKLTEPLGDFTIANAEAVATKVRQRDHIRESRLRIILGGIDTTRFDGVPAGEPEFDILTVARLETIKGILDLIAAMKTVVASRPSARLGIVGDGSLLGRCEALVAELGLGQSVQLLGHRDDVPALLRKTRVFSLASHQEGLPNAIMEAMCAGLPVVATDVGGNGELVLPGVTGSLVPAKSPEKLGQALLPYLEDPDLSRRHGVAGRARVLAQFDVQLAVRAYQALYDEMLSHRSAS